MKITIKTKPCELNGEEDFNMDDVIIESHWNYDERVILCLGDKKLTFIASELERAINRATGWRRY